MERKIVFPKWEQDEILSNHVKEALEDRGGMIVVSNQEKEKIGFVILVHGTWILNTANINSEADSLEELMVNYNSFSFTLVN